VETEKGKGTTFTVALPGRAMVSEAIAAEPAAAYSNGKSLPKVLIAEDDENNAQYYAFALEREPCELLFAVNGQEAVRVAEQHPDLRLVLMDLKMPIMNGFDATRQIKALRNDLPVVATTAYAMTHDEHRAREAGCDDYLAKPIRPQTLTDTLIKYGVLPKPLRNGKH
jgi:CheY-like chemotaxis protein